MSTGALLVIEATVFHILIALNVQILDLTFYLSTQVKDSEASPLLVFKDIMGHGQMDEDHFFIPCCILHRDNRHYCT